MCRWHCYYFLTSCLSSPAWCRQRCISFVLWFVLFFPYLVLFYFIENICFLFWVSSDPFLSWMINLRILPTRLKFKGLTFLSFLKQGTIFAHIPSVNPSHHPPTPRPSRCMNTGSDLPSWVQEHRRASAPARKLEFTQSREVPGSAHAHEPSSCLLRFVPPLQPQRRSFWQKRWM